MVFQIDLVVEHRQEGVVELMVLARHQQTDLREVIQVVPLESGKVLLRCILRQLFPVLPGLKSTVSLDLNVASFLLLVATDSFALQSLCLHQHRLFHLLEPAFFFVQNNLFIIPYELKASSFKNLADEHLQDRLSFSFEVEDVVVSVIELDCNCFALFLGNINSVWLQKKSIGFETTYSLIDKVVGFNSVFVDHVVAVIKFDPVRGLFHRRR